MIAAFVVGVGLPLLLFMPIKREPLPIADYAAKKPLYSDRDYANTLATPLPAGTKVVPIARHREQPIWLTASGPVTIFRMIGDDKENDNSVFADHQELDAKVSVVGQSCTLTRLIKLDLPAGEHCLPPGGPVAAAPLLFAGDAEVTAESRWTLLTWLAKKDP